MLDALGDRAQSGHDPLALGLEARWPARIWIDQDDLATLHSSDQLSPRVHEVIVASQTTLARR